MIMNVEIARREWTARLKEQARQLRVVAVAAQTPMMRDELNDYANRIDRQLRSIETRPAPDTIPARSSPTGSSAGPHPASASC